MGYLVFQPIQEVDQTYSIIDGQEQITKLSLLSLAITYVLKKWSEEGFEKEDSKTRFEKITERYLGNFSLSGLNLNSKLKLNRYNDDFYQSYLLKLRRPTTIAKLKPIYVSDDNFEQAFSILVLKTKSNKNLIKYILVQLENHISRTDYNHEDATSTIEHILPENPGTIWENSFDIDLQSDYTSRLGNYTLLEAGLNHRLGNELSFVKKLEFYKTSKYKISKENLDYDEGILLL